MKKKLLIALSIIGITVGLTGCAGYSTGVDTTLRFDRASIQLPGGEIVEGKVQSWLDWPNSDAIQVKIDGVTYYTHLSNVVMVNE